MRRNLIELNHVKIQGEVIIFPYNMRRNNNISIAENLAYEHVKINVRAREVKSWGNNVHMQRLEFDLLVMLVLNKGCVLSRDRLLDEIWGMEFEGFTRAVDNGISKLRTKLALKQYLVSIPKIGYKLID